MRMLSGGRRLWVSQLKKELAPSLVGVPETNLALPIPSDIAKGNRGGYSNSERKCSLLTASNVQTVQPTDGDRKAPPVEEEEADLLKALRC